MEEKEFIKECLGWDVENWLPALKVWENKLSEKPNSKILELGAGPGGISLWLAKRGHEVVCSDLENPENNVKPLFEKYKVYGNVTFEAVNALNIPYTDHFDFVIFKSVVGGVARDGHHENRKAMMDGIFKSLKSDGVLLFAENLAASPLHKIFRKYFVRWGQSWNYATIKDMTSAMTSFSSVNFKTTGFFGTFGRSEKQRQLLSKIDKVFLNKTMPKSWRYIMYGWAGKS